MFLILFSQSPVAPQSFSHHSGAVHQPQPSSTPTGNQPPPQHAAPSPGQVSGPHDQRGKTVFVGFSQSDSQTLKQLFIVISLIGRARGQTGPNTFTLCLFSSECPVRPTAAVFVPLRSPVSAHPTQHATRPHVSTRLLPHSGLQHPWPPGNPTNISPGSASTGTEAKCCAFSCLTFNKKEWQLSIERFSFWLGPCSWSHARSPSLRRPRSASDSNVAGTTSAGSRLSAPAPPTWTPARGTPTLLHRTSTRYKTYSGITVTIPDVVGCFYIKSWLSTAMQVQTHPASFHPPGN